MPWSTILVFKHGGNSYLLENILLNPPKYKQDHHLYLSAIRTIFDNFDSEQKNKTIKG